MKYFAAIFAFSLLQGWVITTEAAPDLTFRQWVAALDPNRQPDERNSASCAGLADGFHAFPDQCTADYYACISGNYYALACNEPEYVFDNHTGKCVPYSSSSCQTTLPTTTRKPFDCNNASDGNYAISNTCSRSYYMCYNNSMYPQTCPVSSYFDPVKLQCVSQNNSACTTTIPTTATSPINSNLSTTIAPTDTTTDSIDTSTEATESTTTVPTPPTSPPTIPPIPPTLTPVVCAGSGFYQLKGYCGPSYYYCSGIGVNPVVQECPNPTRNYFDCKGSGACTAMNNAYCMNPTGTDTCREL